MLARALLLAVAVSGCASHVATAPSPPAPHDDIPAARGPAPHDDIPAARGRLAAKWSAALSGGPHAAGACATDARDLDKTCRAASDCTIVTEVLDECRTTAHLGVNAAGRAAFAARPPFDPCADGHCPNCNVRWQFAEDCSELDGGTGIVDCVHGRCETHGTGD
nr:hypothetical protein [Kofleriaceae bacterium]